MIGGTIGNKLSHSMSARVERPHAYTYGRGKPLHPDLLAAIRAEDDLAAKTGRKSRAEIEYVRTLVRWSQEARNGV